MLGHNDMSRTKCTRTLNSGQQENRLVNANRIEDREARDHMYIGIDGGGTGTRGALQDAGGRIVGEALAGPGSAIVVGIDRAFEAVASVWQILHKKVGDENVLGSVIGLAGVDRPLVRAEWIRRLDHLIPEPYWLVGDYQLALAALTHGQPGIIGVLGTGSVFFGDDGLTRRRIGGYGWQIGDVGSGIRIGQLGVRAALQALEGTGSKTVLLDLVQQFFDVTTSADILSHWYDKSFEVQKVAKLAGAVLDAADRDYVARRLVEAEARGIVNHLNALGVEMKWHDQWPVGITGGLADRWLPWVAQSWMPGGYRTAIQTVEEPPAIGATWLAQYWVQTCRRSDRGGLY